MKIAHLDRAFTILAFALGLFVVGSAWNYGLYTDGVPGPGFFPIIAGIMMTVLAGGLLLRDVKGTARLAGRIEATTIWAVLGVTAAIVAVVYLAETVGMAAVTVVATIAIGLITEESGKRGAGFALRLVAMCVGVTLLCHLLFGSVIGIPLIEGPLGF